MCVVAVVDDDHCASDCVAAAAAECDRNGANIAPIKCTAVANDWTAWIAVVCCL